MKHLYFNMICRVTIGKIQFEAVNSITIEESTKKLSNSATIILPSTYKPINVNKYDSLLNKNILTYIKVGKTVIIELGYNNDLVVEFTGYIDKINADIPITIVCECEMFNLRKTNFVNAYKSISLKQLLQVIAPNYKYDLIDDIKLGKFTINNESAYQVLERLRKDYGLHSHFVDKVLTVGFPISFKPQITHKLNLNKNVRAQKNDLKFVRKEDFKILIQGISLQRNGKRLTTEFGEKNGTKRTLHFINKTLNELKELTKKNYKSLNFDGYLRLNKLGLKL